MILSVLTAIVAILLIGVVLLQKQSSGLSSAFGGAGEFYRSKRSIEKLLIWVTITLSMLFGVLSILQLVS
jgi:protein translocase SecG subunit